MDNDLMARRLRPPSEPPRPQTAHAPSDQAPWATDQAPPWANDQAPWATDTDVRADVPWDRPADEPWPPADEPWPTDEPWARADEPWPPAGEAVAAEQRVAAEQPAPAEQPVAAEQPAAAEQPVGDEQPVAELVRPPIQANPAPVPDDLFMQGDSEPIAEVSEPVAADRPTTWDDTPAPWDEPEPFDADAGTAVLEPEPEPEPEPESVPEPEAEPDQEPVAEVITAADTEAPETSEDADAPPWAAATIDPDDALAPVLTDVDQQAPPPWAGWADAGATADAAATADVVPPPDAAEGVGPTPPDELFESPPAPDTGAEPAPVTTATTDIAVPALFSTTPTGQPVVVRIEVAIVDGHAVVRPLDAAQAVKEPDTDQVLTPRHPEFEPRNHLNGNGGPAVIVPEETHAPAPWLLPVEPEPSAAPQSAWILPAQTMVVADPWAESPGEPTKENDWPAADPLSAWQLEATEPGPLANLPAASLDDPITASGQAALAASETASPAPTAQPDLWFLSSEPETLAPVDAQQLTREPSPVMTAGLTILMAAVVIALVIAFLWLMTSLPILR